MLQSNDIAIGSQNRLNALSAVERPETDVTGEGLARLFKYYRLKKDPSRNQNRAITLGRVSAKAFYDEHRKAFDMTSNFFTSHRIDARPYIRFFVFDLAKTGRDIDTELYSRHSLSEYASKLQVAEKREKIYKWFMKSVDNIVDICIKNDYMSSKDCILALIRKNRLAQEYVSGRISKYFFAAMPNFRNIISKLDHFAKAEFSELYDKFDIYNTEINSAFLKYRNRVVNPLEVADCELIRRKAQLSASIYPLK